MIEIKTFDTKNTILYIWKDVIIGKDNWQIIIEKETIVIRTDIRLQTNL